jgi:hypothetical protein
MWLISEECIELCDALPILVADEKKDGDVLKSDSIYDDLADCARYGLKSMLSPRSVPKEVQLEQTLAAIPENTQKHLAHLRFERDWSKRPKPMSRPLRWNRGE